MLTMFGHVGYIIHSLYQQQKSNILSMHIAMVTLMKIIMKTCIFYGKYLCIIDAEKVYTNISY